MKVRSAENGREVCGSLTGTMGGGGGGRFGIGYGQVSMFNFGVTTNTECSDVLIELQFVLLKANFRYYTSYIHVCFYRMLSREIVVA